jgi:hypothetical protein
MTRSKTIVRAVTLASLLLPTLASAVVESSCPAPCSVLPKSALFLRETNGTLGVAGDIATLSGTLGKGIRKRVLRIDTTITVVMENAPFSTVAVYPTVNGFFAHPWGVNVTALAVAQCDVNKGSTCSVTGSFWWDLDALEEAHPGMILGQPLVIDLNGGSTTGQGSDLRYWASFSAELVKK